MNEKSVLHMSLSKTDTNQNNDFKDDLDKGSDNEESALNNNLPISNGDAPESQEKVTENELVVSSSENLSESSGTTQNNATDKFNANTVLEHIATSCNEPGSQEVISHQKLIINKQEETLKQLDDKCVSLEIIKNDLENKLENAIKQRDFAIKEKESMVIKYAVSEKNGLEQTELKEQIEKKYKEAIKENELLQHKVQSVNSEKSRICQLLDNKCYELKSVSQELEKYKNDLNAVETKLKWTQINLKTETDAHKECQSKVEHLNSKLQESLDQIQQAKREAQESIKAFHHSQENRAHVLDQQVKEQQASLILLKHEKEDKEQQTKNLQQELERLQTKQNEMMQENNNLSLKVQQLERERLETQHKLSELRGCADQQRQDAADLLAKVAQLEQLKLQLNSERDQLSACKDQMNLLKQRNAELESDMEACRTREAELLIFTQQLTDKNVRLQSEFTSMETKVQQLICEQTLLKRTIKEQETRADMLAAQLAEDRVKYMEETEQLTKSLDEATKLSQKLQQEVADQKGENNVVKRKLELSLREVNKELQHCRRRIEQYESVGNTSHSSNSSSNSSNAGDGIGNSPSSEHVRVIQPETVLDRQTLIEHIVKLQRISAKKSEKIDFLEEHVNTLCAELQKKSRLLQNYILREQSGTMTSNKMDKNKAHFAKLNGVMASVYSSRVADDNLTLELSLDISRKLQEILEDALLKNITLKENVDTLGAEIDRLNSLLKSQC